MGITLEKALAALDDAFKDRLGNMLQIMQAGIAVGDSVTMVSKRFSIAFSQLLDAHNAAQEVVKATIPGDKSKAHP